jgi:hypothetical protein
MVPDIITGTNKTDEEDVKPSLKLKGMPCKQQESDDSEDDDVDKAKSSKRMRVFNFSNCKGCDWVRFIVRRCVIKSIYSCVVRKT